MWTDSGHVSADDGYDIHGVGTMSIHIWFCVCGIVMQKHWCKTCILMRAGFEFILIIQGSMCVSGVGLQMVGMIYMVDAHCRSTYVFYVWVMVLQQTYCKTNSFGVCRIWAGFSLLNYFDRKQMT